MDGTLNRLYAPGTEYVVLSGSFAPNGSSAIDQTTIRGAGIASVARTGVGTYTITLKDKYQQLVAGIFVVQRSAVADGDVKQIGAEDVASAKTIPIAHVVAGVATEIAANSANRIQFVLWLRNSTVTP